MNCVSIPFAISLPTINIVSSDVAEYFKNAGDITKSNIMKYITSTHLTLYKLD